MRWRPFVEADVATTWDTPMQVGVGSGAHIVVSGVFDLTREMAEAQTDAGR